MSTYEAHAKTVADFTARIASAESAATAAVANPETRTAGAVSTRLVIASQILLECARESVELLQIVETGAEGADPMDAATVQVYGKETITVALPLYFECVSQSLETLIAAAADALVKVHPQVAGGGDGLEDAYKIRTEGDKVGGFVTNQLIEGEIVGEDRTKALFGISVLDGAVKLAEECDSLGIPLPGSWSYILGELPLREVLNQVDAEILVGTVLGTVVNILAPMAKELHAKAVAAYPALGKAAQ